MKLFFMRGCALFLMLCLFCCVVWASEEEKEEKPFPLLLSVAAHQPEIVSQTFSFLIWRDLLRVEQTCKTLQTIAKENWKTTPLNFSGVRIGKMENFPWQKYYILKGYEKKDVVILNRLYGPPSLFFP